MKPDIIVPEGLTTEEQIAYLQAAIRNLGGDPNTLFPIFPEGKGWEAYDPSVPVEISVVIDHYEDTNDS